MKNTLVDVLPVHPRTGLVAVFLRGNGTAVWPHQGSDGEDDGGDDGGDDSEDSENDSDDDEDDSEDSDSSEKKKPKSKTVSREEFEDLQKRYDRRAKHLSESDKKKAAAEKELAELKKKDLPDAEKVKTELSEVTKERDALRDKFSNLARTNAFLTASAQEKVSWFDPADAQAVAGKELRELDIDDDGNVDGIRELVKSLAKRKPHLVNSSTGTDDDESKDGKRKNGASGSGVGSGAKSGKGSKKGAMTPEELRKRFPSLRR